MTQPTHNQLPLVIPLDRVEAPVPHAVGVRGSYMMALAILVIVGLGYATRAPRPALAWNVVELPSPSLNLESLIATSEGFSIPNAPSEEGGLVWSSSDGRSWTAVMLPGSPIRIVSDGDDLVAYDARSAYRISFSTGAELVTDIALPELLRTGYGSGRPALVVGERGLLAHTVMGDVFRSFNDRPFQMSVNADRWRTAVDISPNSRCSPPGRVGPDLPPIVSTPAGFYAFVAADDASGVWPICEPIAWTSGDGSIWKPEAAESPFGEGAYVADVDWRDGRFVAVGGLGFDEPAMWISDDALDWVSIEPPSAAGPYKLVEVDGGPMGWVAIGRFSDQPGYTGWVSANGECWELLPGGVAGRTVAVGDDTILITDRSHTGTAQLGTPSHIPLRTTCS